VNPDGSRGWRRDASRAFARRLAADSIASGNDTGWFETLYAAAEHGTATVPWADLAPIRAWSRRWPVPAVAGAPS
jgi:hypothetical protein